MMWRNVKANSVEINSIKLEYLCFNYVMKGIYGNAFDMENDEGIH